MIAMILIGRKKIVLLTCQIYSGKIELDSSLNCNCKSEIRGYDKSLKPQNKPTKMNTIKMIKILLFNPPLLFYVFSKCFSLESKMGMKEININNPAKIKPILKPYLSLKCAINKTPKNDPKFVAR